MQGLTACPPLGPALINPFARLIRELMSICAIVSVLQVQRKRGQHSGYVKLLRPENDAILEDNDSSTALIAETWQASA